MQHKNKSTHKLPPPASNNNQVSNSASLQFVVPLKGGTTQTLRMTPDRCNQQLQHFCLRHQLTKEQADRLGQAIRNAIDSAFTQQVQEHNNDQYDEEYSFQKSKKVVTRPSTNDEQPTKPPPYKKQPTFGKPKPSPIDSVYESSISADESQQQQNSFKGYIPPPSPPPKSKQPNNNSHLYSTLGSSAKFTTAKTSLQNSGKQILPSQGSPLKQKVFLLKNHCPSITHLFQSKYASPSKKNNTSPLGKSVKSNSKSIHKNPQKSVVQEPYKIESPPQQKKLSKAESTALYHKLHNATIGKLKDKHPSKQKQFQKKSVSPVKHPRDPDSFLPSKYAKKQACKSHKCEVWNITENLPSKNKPIATLEYKKAKLWAKQLRQEEQDLEAQPSQKQQKHLNKKYFLSNELKNVYTNFVEKFHAASSKNFQYNL